LTGRRILLTGGNSNLTEARSLLTGRSSNLAGTSFRLVVASFPKKEKSSDTSEPFAFIKKQTILFND
jgi:hypothetical protein